MTARTGFREAVGPMGRVLLVLLLLAPPTLAAPRTFPEGWRPPRDAELVDYAAWLDGPLRDHAELHGDFDGDGLDDAAYLAKSTRFEGQALLVWLSGPDGGGWVVLDERRWPEPYRDVPLTVALRPVANGRTAVFCIREDHLVGVPSCPEHPAGAVDLKHPAIGSQGYGQSLSFFFWDPAQRRLVRASQAD